MFNKVNPKQDFIKSEHKVLEFWNKNSIFDKLRQKNQDKKQWSFLDGPITANNPMGVHHAWGRTLKDLYQRYYAMKGFDERYQNGFDCQGLWVEVEVEKELGLKTKKDIENLVPNDKFASIAKFVELCKERVQKFSKIQIDQSIRLGQWMDWENSYYTDSEENNYAIWYFLKKCHKNGWLYKGHDSVPWCPRCGTAISQHEILTEEYKELIHRAVYLKLPIISANHQNENLLVWTTTPWTLPINVAVAVDPKKEYCLIDVSGEKLWILTKLIGKVIGNNVKTIRSAKGSKLISLNYKTPFDDLETVKKGLENYKHRVVASDKQILPISEAEGTGLVHLASGAGSEDYKLGKKEKLPAISPLDENGVYQKGFDKYSGNSAKEVSEMVLDDLQKNHYAFKIEDYKHRYPTCWRCKEELVYRLVDEWYISMDIQLRNLKFEIRNSKKDTLRNRMIEIAKKIKWMPEYGLNRELDWLKNMNDWLISKKRYWGLALPVFECPKCKSFEVIGSKKELEEKTIEGWEKFKNHSPHKPWIDQIKIKCSKCGELSSRIPDVGNPWLDAGIVPFSTMYYFSDREKWGKWFPADFICESMPGQFKNWFYSLIAMSAVLENQIPFKNILGFETVKDENGEIMHKSKGNSIKFDDAAEKTGSDVMRWMYVSNNPFRNLRFGYHNANKVLKELVLTLWNSYSFFVTYANLNNWNKSNISKSNKILDQWIIVKQKILINNITENLDKFQHSQAAENIQKYIVEDLSTWYIRRNRKRNDPEFFSTLYSVLKTLTILIAPIMPFLAENIYQNLKTSNDPESVHLNDWIKSDNLTDHEKTIINDMQFTRNIVSSILSAREKVKIKIRQPLSFASYDGKSLDNEYLLIIQDETNIKKISNRIEFSKSSEDEAVFLDTATKITIVLNTKITKELKEEGAVRDLIRLIQGLRKKRNLIPGEKVILKYFTENNQIKQLINKNQSEIMEKTYLSKIIESDQISDESSEIKLLDDKILKIEI